MINLPFDIQILIDICRKYNVNMVSVFGSMIRGEAKENSDIDLIVRFSKRISLLTLVALERELSTALGRKVDVLTENSISPYLRDKILQEQQVIYEVR